LSKFAIFLVSTTSKKKALVSLEIPPTHHIFPTSLPLLNFLFDTHVSSISTISPISSIFCENFFVIFFLIIAITELMALYSMPYSCFIAFKFVFWHFSYIT
ncbi:hypothetical protein CDIK_1289, partial [Cucumispora dikerogammari]